MTEEALERSLQELAALAAEQITRTLLDGGA